MSGKEEDLAVTRFREFLRIKSVHPNPDYDSCIKFIRKQAEEIGLEFHEVRLKAPAEFAIWATWKGSDPSLKSIMLNCHLDVVPVDESKWDTDPFAAVKDGDGNIYARGTQDMKSVGMQYLEAIRRLKAKGLKPKRTIHVTFVPDEELGSSKGMEPFVRTPEFKGLNVGFGLDEGGAIPAPSFLLFNAERALWQIRVRVKGNTGHALHFIENTAAEKARRIINAFLNFREEEKGRLGPRGTLDLGNVTTINMTMIEGGLQPNVVAPEITITFDLRIPPTWSEKGAMDFIEKVLREAGDEVEYEFLVKGPVLGATPLTKENKWWTSFKAGCDDAGIELLPITCPGATDARFLREIGVPALGFSPMNNTPILLHDNNEFLNEGVYLRGISIYEDILQRLWATQGD